ncbi:hypothetical protein ACQP3D_30015, partial [Escherichia coli]
GPMISQEKNQTHQNEGKGSLCCYYFPLVSLLLLQCEGGTHNLQRAISNISLRFDGGLERGV